MKLNDSFTLHTGVAIVTTEETKSVAELLAESMREMSGLAWAVSSRPGDGAGIGLSIDADCCGPGEEGYMLSVNSAGVDIEAASVRGLFYGTQTFLQLLPPAFFEVEANAASTWEIRGTVIEDAPRFAWRGLLVDLSRHFFDKEQIYRIVDQMANLKLNVLHLHLTDDPGWRLEVEQFPNLTAIGAIGDKSNPNAPAQFLSKEDVKDIVEYAGARYIDMVPEIDMPGHAGAAARAYPEYFDGNVTFNMGKRETYEFVEELLIAVAEMFPSRYFHFGGDELRNHNLLELPEVLRFMEANDYSSIEELESHFDRFVADFLIELGRTPIGWDEVAKADLDRRAIIQWWRGLKPEVLDQAVAAGHRVIVSPVDYTYLDYPAAVGEPGAPWEGNHNGPNSLQLIYDWDPIPSHFTESEENQIIGIEAAMWTEFIRSMEYFEYMLNPRLAAVAEIAWSSNSKSRDLHEFDQRLQIQFRRYEAAGINYRIPNPNLPGDNSARYMTH